MKKEVNSEPQKIKKTPKGLIVAITIIAGLYFLAPICFFFFAIIEDELRTNYVIATDGSILLDHEKLTIMNDVKGYYNEEKKAYYIEGKLKNNTDKDYQNINITYYVYNEEGNILGEATTYLIALEAGKTWNFKAVYDDIDANHIIKFEYKNY